MHPSYINTKDFVNIYRKCIAEPYSFLVDDTTLAPNNSLRFRKNLAGIECNSIKCNFIGCNCIIWNHDKSNHGQIRDEKLQYDINREAAEISAKSSGKFHKYKYLTGEDILPSNQQQITEQVRLTYSPLGKAFEKQIKTI